MFCKYNAGGMEQLLSTLTLPFRFQANILGYVEISELFNPLRPPQLD
jgi:hypothetical protein